MFIEVPSEHRVAALHLAATTAIDSERTYTGQLTQLNTQFALRCIEQLEMKFQNVHSDSVTRLWREALEMTWENADTTYDYHLVITQVHNETLWFELNGRPFGSLRVTGENPRGVAHFLFRKLESETF